MRARSFKVYPKRNLVSINWKDAPSVQDWYDVIEHIIEHPDYRRGMNFISARENHGDPVTPDYVRNVLGVLERRADCINPGSLALVAAAPCDYGMARMMETLSDSATVVVRAFKHPREAMEWLKNPVPFSERKIGAVA